MFEVFSCLTSVAKQAEEQGMSRFDAAVAAARAFSLPKSEILE
jgi:hypothetical protein